ncbi:MAG: hypothetical protein ACJ72A_02990 [Nocardioidaceae bacterium]
MAASLAIEEEQGACTGHYHPHNGYYAGDFSNRDHCTSIIVESSALSR